MREFEQIFILDPSQKEDVKESEGTDSRSNLAI